MTLSSPADHVPDDPEHGADPELARCLAEHAAPTTEVEALIRGPHCSVPLVPDCHYEREVYSYRRAAAALGPGTAPRLCAVMTSALPGVPVKGMELSAIAASEPAAGRRS
ncbi:hypothetical protein OIE62_06890 [Streptomyces scopuliridis]|uniref:Uncharacterized protein n=1 Tax=Streptomyces scopuliridis TaxID=452529 RepID=A0ACD4ZV78_9ACTN|nr:hypothetical protein [Streptomyces scopuliridis]WSC01693.1 hypothetical protein OG835_34930 [Streptomyces scopuliridis]WSC04768.1 hypothetical protein OIE62_06890 [Streptomyces scopuliridis]